MADLSEHITVALAERPGELDQILAELGDPHDIATAAVRENAQSTPDQVRGNPRTVLTLLALGSTVGLLAQIAGHGEQLNFPVLVLNLLGLATLAVSAWWTTSRKWITVLWFIAPNLLMHALDQALGLGHGAEVVLSCAAVSVRAAVLVWLWRHRVAPEGPGRISLRIPRWAGILLWGALLLFLVLEVILWISAFAVTDGLSQVKTGTLH
ncbi:hypothetical protein V2W30_39520 (plasmid) [Streptomyces sp. Q6]|uniref:Uncharacterized protein n=1 Tax=Streptomyces citrinus TaxID=3118173 RepID=A0ACD5APY7_9ACTN